MWIEWKKGPVFAADGASSTPPPAASGQAAPPAAAPATAKPGGDAGGQPANYMGQMRADAATPAPKGDAGDPPPADGGENPPKTEGQGEGTPTDPQPTEFVLEAPDSLADFADDFTAYSEAAQQWITDNPDATVADALKFAADFQGQRMGEAMEAAINATQENADRWEAELKADADFGGENYDANVAVAVKAVETFGDAALMDELTRTGLGSHPGLVKAFFKAGQLLKEAPVPGSAPGEGKRSITQALYGSNS